MVAHCNSCKGKTEDVDPQVYEIQTSRGPRYQVKAKCKVCGKNKCKFISAHEAHGMGLIGDMIKKFAPGTKDTVEKVQNVISSIPFIGPLLGAVA
jgi:Domain of unknown function (DUF5679)